MYIAAETRLSSDSRIRLWRTRAFGGGSWSNISITSAPYDYYRKPCLTIVQNRYPTKMVITYTRNATSSATSGLGRRSHSYNGGFAWSHGSLGSSYTTRYTGVSSDTNGSSGYCTFIWGDTDSLNVRRGTIVGGSGGTTYYDRASYTLTSSADPVCAVYNNSSGNYRRSTFAYWRYWSLVGIKNIYFDGEDLPTGITINNGVANTYSLSQNYPNPFNPTTNINFSIPKDGLVELVVFDVLGKEVAALLNKEQTAGNYQVTFDASKLTSGVYFYKITSGDFSDVKKMLLIK